MNKFYSIVLLFCLIFVTGCATYPNTYIQDSTITTNTQGGVVGGPVGGGSYYPNNPGTFLQWLIFGPPGGYYGGGYGWGGYYPPAYGGGGFWYNGNGGGWGGGCW